MTDDFEAPTLNMARWVNPIGAAVTSDGVNEPSGSNSLALLDDASLETVMLAGSSAPADFGVSMLVETDSVEVNERLVAEYKDGAGSWTELAGLEVDGSNAPEYRWFGVRFPSGVTLSDDLKVRLRAEGDEANDAFYIDDVAIGSTPAVGVPWMETFEGPIDSTLVWASFTGTRTGAQADTGTFSAALDAGESMESGAVDTSDYSTGADAFVSFRVKAVGVGSGDVFSAQVKNAAGSWQPLTTITSDGVDDAAFTVYESDLDAGWVSTDFAIRFIAGAGTGTWYVDNVYVGPTQFVLSCNPADLNADGVLNLDDINLFAAAFTSGDLAADLDDNGVLNLDDINSFAQAFVAGCP